jgi:hypothetical protein
MSENQMATQKKLKFGSLLVAVITATVGWGTAAHAQAVKGTGTVGTIPVWNGIFNIGDSIVSQSGSNINVNGGVKASSFSGNGSGLSNVNAATVGGVGASGFAQLAVPNLFSASQSINGNLTLSGSLNNTLTLQSDVTVNQEESANVIGGFGGNSTVPANSVASGVVGATIAGGGGTLSGGFVEPNTVTVAWGTIGGGAGNTAAGRFDTVAGGVSNTASGFLGSMVGGGRGNTASGLVATIGGGDGNSATGDGATVPGGFANLAAGMFSFAAGSEASANSDGSFVWNDNAGGTTTDIGANSFVARASGGFAFYTAKGAATGAYLPAGSGSWASLSDRNVKANVVDVDGQDILERLASLPIATWNYKTQAESVRHIGPMAQDFRQAFGLGEDEKHISTVDSEGVALAAIQQLYREKQDLKNRLEALESRLATLESSPK